MLSTLETVPVADRQCELEAIWNAAIKEYEKVTKVPLPSKTPSAISRDGLLHLVEEEQKKFAEFRSKGQLWPVVKVVLGLVDSLAEVAGAGVSVVSIGN